MDKPSLLPVRVLRQDPALDRCWRNVALACRDDAMHITVNKKLWQSDGEMIGQLIRELTAEPPGVALTANDDPSVVRVWAAAHGYRETQSINAFAWKIQLLHGDE